MNRRKEWPGGAGTPPEALTHATYQAAGDTVVPALGGSVHDPGHVAPRYEPWELDQVAQDVYAVIEMYAGVDGVSRVPERHIAALLGIGRHRVRTAKMRLERHQCINVIPGPRQPDGRLRTATFQLTTGAWKHLWHAPCPRRQKAHETFAKRAKAMPDRRPDLVEKLAQVRGRAQERALERALVGSQVSGERAQGARPESAPKEVLRTSKGAASKRAAPPYVPPAPAQPISEEAKQLTRTSIAAIREKYGIERKANPRE